MVVSGQGKSSKSEFFCGDGAVLCLDGGGGHVNNVDGTKLPNLTCVYAHRCMKVKKR